MPHKLKADQNPNTTRTVSMEEVHRTVAIPHGHWFRRLFTFAGPAYLVSVGYMDPGNWATDLEGGATHGYTLIWVLLMSNMMAVLLQVLSARLGLVTGRDLAQACYDDYPAGIRWILFVLCEIAIAACDLAEVLGTAIGINLLTNGAVPMIWAVGITGFDVLLLLAMQRWGIRKMEAFILALVATIGGCFIVELFLSEPSFTGMASGFIPRPFVGNQLYIAIGIIGATVMPHNLYLHSSLVQSRKVGKHHEGIRQACRYNFIETAIALNAAFFVNAAILVLAASAFWTRGIEVTEIQQAHRLLENVLGTRVAPIAFAVALICAGQSSTITGTMAGQITMEGFLHFKIRPWLRRLITRSIAIVPAIVVIALAGEHGTYRLLILSQVVLSLQLPFAIIPLIKFTNSKQKMGPFANKLWVAILGWIITVIIVYLNGMLVYQQLNQWSASAGQWSWLVNVTSIPIIFALVGLMVWMIFKREVADVASQQATPEYENVLQTALQKPQQFQRIGIALEATDNDAHMLREAIELAKSHHAHLILMHVVEGPGGQWYGQHTCDAERRHDELFMENTVARLRDELLDQGVKEVTGVLGYGKTSKQLAELAKREKVDIMIVGGHGHGRLADIFRGESITTLRHAIKVPLLAVPASKK